MTISKAQIFNISLNICGVSTPLENPNSSDNKAILLNNYYELAKEYVLKDFDWNFASTYRVLTLTQNQISESKFKYCYDYPNNCICARGIFEQNTNKEYSFSISCNNKGEKVILTDCKNAVLRFTQKIEKEIYFSCEFSMALSYYLASLTAGVITGSSQKGEIAYQKYKEILRKAKVLNAQEGVEEVYDDNTYLDTRG